MPIKPDHTFGLLNINKPQGLTSHDVVARVRKLANQRKVGHAGTLDPMATGVLLLCLGQATRLIEYLVPGQKQYRAVIRFGITTDTLDAEGQITSQNDASGLTESHLREILPAFTGKLEQIPPIFSAIKKDGQPLYKKARAGHPVEVTARPVTIHTLSWVAWHPPCLTLDVACSSGTYIRSLARDLGEAAGTGAHLAALTRTASGNWQLDDAISLAFLEAEAAKGETVWQSYLHSPDKAITHLPQVTLTQQQVIHIKHGRQIYLNQLETASPDPMLLRAYTPSQAFLAILTRVEPNDKLWQPKKVFHTSE